MIKKHYNKKERNQNETVTPRSEDLKRQESTAKVLKKYHQKTEETVYSKLFEHRGAKKQGPSNKEGI